MRARIIVFLLLGLILGGCGSPERRGMLKYLHKSDELMTQLVDFQRELSACGKIQPNKKRFEVLTDWESRIKARHQELNQLEVPPAAQKYHEHLNGMFQALEDYGLEYLGANSPEKFKQCQDRWKEEYDGVNKELNTLRV
jgi:hypothetical protein